MALEASFLSKIIKLMKKEGVLHLKTPDYDISLAHQALERKVPKKTKLSVDKKALMEEHDQDLANLLWSAPGSDVMDPLEGTHG